ncbi:MAG TPA: nitrate ABC transporter permease [Rhodocyclaceae bacterium]
MEATLNPSSLIVPGGTSTAMSAAPAANSSAPPAAAGEAETRAGQSAEPTARHAINRKAMRTATLAASRWLIAVVAGLGALIVVWWAVSSHVSQFPGPLSTWHAALELFADPFYDNGPNDQGIGWNVYESLKRVGIGFGLAAAVGIPLGFAIGRVGFLRSATDPVISLLRPVSPLAWLPIGLLVFKDANLSAIWVIFICSIWPMIINTAAGVRAMPQDYLNVARVLDLPEAKIITKIYLPAVLPHILTGVRLSVGTAWLVIVAAEMLTGGIGIGFWVWDEWNNLNVEHILIAIFVIGVVGLLLEQALMFVARRCSYESR